MEDLERTSDFLFYNSEDGTQKVQVIVGEETVWATQRGMSEIFSVEANSITYHIGEIYKSGELDQNSTTRKIRVVQKEGAREVARIVEFYNLDVIIAVGYRVNSYNATKFRMWATRVLKEYLIKGFAMDDERLKQGNNLFNKDYFKELLNRIREIRASEKMFYEKVKELYATSVDYDKNAPETQVFFQKVQNKLEFAIVGKTAAEIIKDRADSKMPNMNLKTWKNVKKEGDIQKSDVTVAKNYLDEKELRELNLLVNIFLDQAELLAEKNRLMKMQDWINRLDALLRFNEYKVLDNAGTVRKEVADKFAEGEYEKYKVIRNLSYNKDFDKVVSQIKGSNTLPKEITITENKQESEFDKQLKGLLKVPPPKKDK
jgi:hypothetical protein